MCADERTRTSNPYGTRTSIVRVYQVPPRPQIKSVPEVGVEPTIPEGNAVLNDTRIPIPPLWHWRAGLPIPALALAKFSTNFNKINPFLSNLTSRTLAKFD